MLNGYSSSVIGVLHVQVKVPGLQGRFDHCAAAFHCQGLTEVTIFGGCPKWPSNYQSDADLPQTANTTVLQFGMSTLYYNHAHPCAQWK